jgi:hypothetical protein
MRIHKPDSTEPGAAQTLHETRDGSDIADALRTIADRHRQIG